MKKHWRGLKTRTSWLAGNEKRCDEHKPISSKTMLRLESMKTSVFLYTRLRNVTKLKKNLMNRYRSKLIQKERNYLVTANLVSLMVNFICSTACTKNPGTACTKNPQTSKPVAEILLCLKTTACTEWSAHLAKRRKTNELCRHEPRLLSCSSIEEWS